jgi:hypothetical protein
MKTSIKNKIPILEAETGYITQATTDEIEDRMYVKARTLVDASSEDFREASESEKEAWESQFSLKGSDDLKIQKSMSIPISTENLVDDDKNFKVEEFLNLVNAKFTGFAKELNYQSNLLLKFDNRLKRFKTITIIALSVAGLAVLVSVLSLIF